MATAPPVRLVTAIGRRLDQAVCNGSIANAARSVSLDQARADQRRDARAAVEQLERMFDQQVLAVIPPPRRTG